MSDEQQLQPIRLSQSYEDGDGLEELAPWPEAMQIRPIKTHKLISWYVGPKLSSMVYAAGDGVLQFTDLPYDEHCRVLNGVAILTSADGTVHEFHAGDTFVAPFGWTGTWEMKEGYREEITFETGSLDAAMAAWFDV